MRNGWPPIKGFVASSAHGYIATDTFKCFFHFQVHFKSENIWVLRFNQEEASEFSNTHVIDERKKMAV